MVLVVLYKYSFISRPKYHAYIVSFYTSIYSISNAQKVAVTPVFSFSAPGMPHMAFWHNVVHLSTSAGAVFWPRFTALTLLRMRAYSSLEKDQAKGYWNAEWKELLDG